MATSDGPITVGMVTLVVNSLATVAAFYRDVVGLNEINTSTTSCELGAGNTVLLKLIEDRSARHAPNEAGLFHTAFLLPDRHSLGSWINHAANRGLTLDGVADHLVSEAVYLSDPEGNGVEIYADRDRSHWEVDGDLIKIDTIALDVTSLRASAEGVWAGVPEGSVIGHVHLQVGDVARADDFYRDKLGFTRSASMGSASFYGSGGYHHQLAGNIWNSRGSQSQPSGARGLAELELLVTDHKLAGQTLADPWGVQVRLTENRAH